MAEKVNKTDGEFYDELIAKELSGEISEAEKTILLEWVNKGEDNRALYEKTKRSWKTAVVKKEIPHFDTEAAWTKVKARTSEAEENKERKIISLNSRSTALKIAATILLLVGVFALLRITLFNAPEAVNYTAMDNKLEIYLPDSSKVVLNKNSHLTYYTDYNSEGRKVYLEGEAFFEVQKSPSKKFEVFGVRSVTTVLGTSFSVRSVKNEAKEIVQVVTGRVSLAELNKEKNQIILTPGLRGELDQSSNLTISEITDPNFIAWKQNRLIFENAELSVVTQALEEYFGLEFEVQDQLLLSCRFTGTFTKPTADEVLEVLAVSTNSSYKMTGKKVTLTGKGCNKN
jgi:transmembrane sensor